MKITVNKAKIKKLANFAKAAKNSTLFQKVNFYKGRAWATNGYTVFSCNYTAIDEPVRDILQIDAGALLEVIGKAGVKKEIEIDLDIFVFSSDALGALKSLFEGLMEAPPLAKISRMLWALLQPKGAGEHCNFLLTSDKIKAELYEKEENTDYCKNWIFRGGCELNEQNEIKTPLLLAISELKLQSIVKNKNACFSIIYHEKQNQYYLNYESDAGEIYVFCPQIEKFNPKGSNNYFSDEIKSAYQSAIEQMKEQSEPATEPEPTTIEPVKTESEESKMQEKKEIEPTEPTTAAEPIQNEEIQTSETTPEPTAATAAESVQNPEPEKENCPPIVSKAAPDVSEIIELFRNFDDYSAHHALEELFQKEQEKKGFLYFSEIIEICKAINAGAWNTFFYCRPMHFGATLSESPEPGARVIVSDSVYSFENRLGYSEEERAEKCKICGNAKAQFKVSFCCEILEPLKPTEKLERFKNHWNKEYIGRPYVLTPSDAIHTEVKAMIKTLNDYKRVAGHLYGKSGNYNSPISQCFHYYRDGEEITDKEPGGASRIEDYSIERVPNHNAIIVNFTLTSKKPQPKPEPEKKQEELKPTPAPIEIKREPEPVKVAVAAVPAPVVACKVAAPVQIPEPEPKPTTEEPDPEQIDKTKPTGAELRYSLSLLAMPYPIDTLIEKFLKKTNKPVRYSIVEKLLMTIDRGSVPKPGESKREYIKTYYQTH